MPELPEVEAAARVARAVVQGKTIASVRALHPSQRRGLPPRVAATLTGDVVVDVARRGKHQLLLLASGRGLHVHFRMSGDWHVGRREEPLPRFARVVLEFDDGTRLVLDDPRALSTVTVHERAADALPGLGPEATDPTFDARALAAALTTRRGPIKPALLDQRVVAGIGNIYAAESLWHARLDPRRAANTLDLPLLQVLVRAIRHTLAKALRQSQRYYGVGGAPDAIRFVVYDREGKPCRRCRTPIARFTQAGRSTYFCPGCQR